MLPNTHPSDFTARYRLMHLIGSGGMGQVFRAHDRLTDSEIALKCLNLQMSVALVNTTNLTSDSLADWGYTLAREFTTLAGLRHRHIIDVRDFGFADGQPFYTMSLLENAQTLIEATQNQPLPEIVRLLGEVLLALAYLHQHGIIHRDVKPENVLVTDQRIVRLMDFGLAIEAVNAYETWGTLQYAAPELLDESQRPSPASDLYAVGVMAFEILSRSKPYTKTRGDLEAIIAATISGQAQWDLLDAPLSEHPLTSDQQAALKAFIQKLMQVRPQDRYPSANAAFNALYAAVDLPLPPETSDLRESFLQAARFVGRENELNRLKSALTAVRDGRGSAWLIGGESGVGKSRLIGEIRIRAFVSGHLVLNGEAAEGGGLPYQLWRNVLPRLVLELDLTDLEASVLKPAVLNIERLVGRPVADAPNLPGEVGRQRFALTLVNLLRRLGQPTLLILEDLHWHDDLETLNDLLRALPELPLMIIGTFRDDERGDLPTQLSNMNVMRLARLTDAETVKLSQSMLGEIAERTDVLDALRRETEGNAFFLVEVLRALAEESGGLAQIRQRMLPAGIFASGVERIIYRRLGRIPDWGQPLLRLAAIIGRQLDLAVLRQAILQDHQLLSNLTLENWLEKAAEASVLILNAERWDFAHDKLRESLVRSLEPQLRPQLHYQAARAIEAAYPDNPTYDETLLQHWKETGHTERILHYLLPVVRNMVEIHARYQAAEELIAYGLSLLTEDDIRRAILFNQRSSSSLAQADYQAAADYAKTALALAERLDNRTESAQSLSNIGMAARERADYPTAETCFQQSLNLYRELQNAIGIARSLNNLGAISHFRGEYAQSEVYFQQGFDLSSSIQYKLGVALSLNNLGIINRERGNYASAEAYYRQSSLLYREIGHLQGTARILNNLANVAADRGEFHSAENYYQESLSLSRSIGDPRGIDMVLNNLGKLSTEKQEYAVADNYFQQSLEICQSIDDSQGKAVTLNNMGSVAYYRGDYETAISLHQQSLNLAREIGEQYVIAESLSRLCILACRQDWQALPAYLQESLSICLELDLIPIVVELIVTIAQCELKQGQVAEAAKLAGLVDAFPEVAQELRIHELARLLKALGEVLPEAQLTALMKEGAAFDLATTARSWLNRISQELAEK